MNMEMRQEKIASVVDSYMPEFSERGLKQIKVAA